MSETPENEPQNVRVVELTEADLRKMWSGERVELEWDEGPSTVVADYDWRIEAYGYENPYHLLTITEKKADQLRYGKVYIAVTSDDYTYVLYLTDHRAEPEAEWVSHVIDTEGADTVLEQNGILARENGVNAI